MKHLTKFITRHTSMINRFSERWPPPPRRRSRWSDGAGNWWRFKSLSSFLSSKKNKQTNTRTLKPLGAARSSSPSSGGMREPASGNVQEKTQTKQRALARPSLVKVTRWMTRSTAGWRPERPSRAQTTPPDAFEVYMCVHIKWAFCSLRREWERKSSRR